MALQSWGHSSYWAASSTGGGGGGGGSYRRVYPCWGPPAFGKMGGMLLASGFGGAQAWWDRVMRWWAVARHCWGLTPDQARAVSGAALVVRQPIFLTAQQAVRDTAIKPTMRDHHYWHEVGRVAKAWNWSENIYRRIDANETADRMLRAGGSTSTHMMRELAVELAYHAYRDRG